MTGAAAKDVITPNTFTHEPDSLVNRHCTDIVFGNPQVQALEIQRLEGIAAKETSGFDPYSPPSPPFLTDQDSELGDVIEPVDAVEVAIADEAVFAFGFDGKNDVRVRFVL